MKYLWLFLLAFSAGYFVYPVLNPVQTIQTESIEELYRKYLLEQGLTKTQIKAASGTQNEEPDNKNTEVKPAVIDVKVEPEFSKKESAPVIVNKMDDQEKTLAEIISGSSWHPKSYITLLKQPYLNENDSRIKKLTGTFKGKLKLNDSRTGLLENLTFAVNADPEKQMTRFEAIDVYDNPTIVYYKETNQSFRAVPGDENLLLIELSSERSVILDLKRFPTLSGRIITLNKSLSDFKLSKSR